jgi:hypothetical protein
VGLPDGRYLARDADGGDGAGGEQVLVIRTLEAPRPGRRRRQRPKDADAEAKPETLPLTRVTAVRAAEPFSSEDEAVGWLDEATEAEDTYDVLVAEGMALLNRALHANGIAAGDPYQPELTPGRATAVRIGYGSGDEVADGRFAAAREVDMRGGLLNRRRNQDLRPQERLAAILGGRESLDVCETLILRARADLDGGRMREAALQLRVGLEAMLVELRGALEDPGHSEDMGVLGERRGQAGDAANAALRGDLGERDARNVSELIAVAERVIRRRRILRG